MLHSTLDWLATTMALQMLSVCDMRSEVPPVPTATLECRPAISDHVPVRFMFRRRPPNPPQSRPLPLWWIAHPLYNKFL